MHQFQASLIGRGVSLLTPTADGTNGQAVVSNGAGVLSFATISGASPSGSGTEVQIRSGASTFGAITGSSSTNGGLALVSQLNTSVALKVTGAASQSGNYFECNSSSGSGGDRFKVTSTGNAHVASSLYIGSGNYIGFTGNTLLWGGSTGKMAITSWNDGINGNEEYWFLLGGDSASFPALKRAVGSTTLQFKLANNSGDCPFSAASGILQGLSSTSTTRSRADWTAAAIDNTDATRKYRAIHQAYDTAAREYARGWGDGSVGRIAVAAPASAPTDAHLAASQISFYLDEAGHNLLVRAKYADGTTLKLATIALA